MSLLTYTKPGTELTLSDRSIRTSPEKVVYEEAGDFDNLVLDNRSLLCIKLFPTGLKRELKSLFHLGWPAAVATFFTTLMGVVSLMFCGHLGREELDAVGLAMSLVNITGISIVIGLSTACDTLFSQAYGGNKKHLFGVYLQRSLLVMCLFVVACWCLHLNTEGILIILGQNRTVARLAGVYVLYFMPAILFQCIYQVLIRYLQNQNRILPTVVFGAVGNVFNATAQYIGIYILDGGLIGSALAQVMAYFVMLVTSIAYTIVSGLYKDTWGGWSIQALERWGEFIQLAVAGLVMTAIEWWCFEIGIFLNGVLGEVELGATSVLFQVEQLGYMFLLLYSGWLGGSLLCTGACSLSKAEQVPYGIAIASSIRVGQSLGAGNAKSAMTTARVSQVFALMGFAFVSVLLLSLKNVVPKFFTTDEAVVQLVSKIIPLLAVLAFLDCVVATSMGTLRGCGRQWIGAACNTIGYIVISLPLSTIFMFVLDSGAPGLWWGLLIGVSVTASLYFYMIMFRINWDEEVVKAQIRLSEKSAVSGSSERTPLIAEENNGHGYIRGHPSLSNGSVIDHNTAKTTIEQRQSRHKRTTLILKRILACFLTFSLLIAGLCVRMFVPLPAEPLIPSMQNETSSSSYAF